MNMSQSFFVPGPLPGLNEMLAWAKRQGHSVGRKGKRWGLYAQEKKSWEDLIIVAIRQARLRPILAPVVIQYEWVEANRRRDKSNIAAGKKLIEDTLVRAGVLMGDGWRDVVGFADSFAVDKKRPGVRVSIREAEVRVGH